MAEVRSGSFNTSGYADSDPLYADYCVFSWTLKSQDIEKATSTIEWTLKGAGGTGNYYTIVRERYVTVNGTTKSESTSMLNVATGTVVFSGTTTIQHNTTTGAGSFSASAGIAFYYYGSYNSTGSGTWSLPTIARATKIDLPASATMGSNISMTLTPAVSTYKHKLVYEFGSLKNQVDGFKYSSGTVIGTDYTTAGSITLVFAPPTTLGWEIPNTTSGTCTVYCSTYTSSGTLIGTTSDTITLNVPDYTPNISLITLTGVNTLSDAYIMGKSSVNIKTTANSSYGGSITTISSTIDGVTYNGANFTTGVMAVGGQRTFTITVYDSRGKSASKASPSINVYAYAIPNISTFNIKRDTSDPTKAIATLKGGVYSLGGKNSKKFTVKLNGVTNTLTSTSESIDTTTTFTNVPTDNTLIATATITDSYTSVSQEAVLPTVAVTMDFLANGKGVAFGKVAETSSLLEVEWDARVNKTLNVKGNTTLDGTLTVKQGTTMSGSLSVTGNASLNSALIVGGNVSITGSLTVGGKTLLNYIYPVGSIYMSVNSTSPANLFGGTWERLKDRFLLGSGDTYSNGVTGGAATHTLSVSEIPSHNHPYGVYDASSTNSMAINHMAAYCGKVNSVGWGSHTLYTGGGSAHNNMPPYLAVYMWKRTA